MCKRCEQGGEGCNGVFSKNWLMKMTSNNSVNVDFAKSWKHKLIFEHTKHKQYSHWQLGYKQILAEIFQLYTWKYLCFQCTNFK